MVSSVRLCALGLLTVSGASLLTSCKAKTPLPVDTPVVPVATVEPATLEII